MGRMLLALDLRDEAGQSVVELALVLLVLMTLVFGGIEFGRLVNSWAIVTQASREGARVGAATCTLDPSCGTDVETRIDGSLTGIDVSAARWSYDGGPYAPGEPFTVVVEYDFTPVTPLISAFFPNGFMTVSADTTMRLE